MPARKARGASDGARDLDLGMARVLGYVVRALAIAAEAELLRESVLVDLAAVWPVRVVEHVGPAAYFRVVGIVPPHRQLGLELRLPILGSDPHSASRMQRAALGYSSVSELILETGVVNIGELRSGADRTL